MVVWRTQAFSVSESWTPAVVRLVARVEDGLVTDYLPWFSLDSWEFAQVQAYYGPLFLSFFLPEHFGQVSNVQKRKGCLETRFADLTPLHVSKQLLKLLLAHWKDFSVQLLRAPECSSETLQDLKTALESLEIAGLLPRVNAALARARKHTPILMPFRLTRTLLHRVYTSAEEKDWIMLENQPYCIRPGAVRLVQRLQRHPRCQLRLCCSKPDLALIAADALKAEGLGTAKKREILRECPGFEDRNTVFVGWKSLKPSQDIEKTVLRRLERYLLELLDSCDSDVRRYFETHPYS